MLSLSLALIFVVVFYLYYTEKFKYWSKRNVKHDAPVPVFGNFFKVYTKKMSITQIIVDTYRKYPNEKVVGMYVRTMPVLLIRDKEIIKQILTVDFNYFYSRGLLSDKYESEPMLKNLAHANGDLWRLLRQRMTPAFTSGKLRAMFPLIVELAEQLKARALMAANSGTVIDVQNLMARFTIDFIGACGFGLDANSLNNENSAFVQLGKNIFESGPIMIMKTILKHLFPVIFQNLKYHSNIEKQLISLVKQILEQRKYVPSSRNDFIDLLIECKNLGRLVGESIERCKSDGTPENVELEMDEALMAAQVFVFFAAGFETSSFSMSMTLHQLAYHTEIQKKVQEEIDRVLIKYDNKLCYDAIKDMPYLLWSFKESMRILPSIGTLSRKCVRPYKCKDLNFSIDKDVGILIPVEALHNDPMYFDNPEEFRPERFDPEQFKQENKYVYLPFGAGPRTCIGERLGLMESMTGLAAILSRFTVSPAPKTLRHPVIDPGSFIVQSVKGGIPLILKERQIS